MLVGALGLLFAWLWLVLSPVPRLRSLSLHRLWKPRAALRIGDAAATEGVHTFPEKEVC